MLTFEIILCLLVCGILLTMLAPRLGLPWPALLALAGTGLAFVPGVPKLPLDPELALALFFAPVLLDAAYDTSPRTLLKNWKPVGSLVVVAVLLTVGVVALIARAILPEMGWPAAIALGAIVAPPDAAAATAVLQQIRLPRRLVLILEGESLLNDASVLLIYRVALDAVHGQATVWTLPILVLSAAGGIAFGYALARIYLVTVPRVVTHENVAASVLLQFLGTFSVWIAADRLGMSAVLTVVAYGMTIAQRSRVRMGPRERRLNFAIWEVAVFGLNVLAFLITGLQIRQIFDELNKNWNYLALAASVLVACIVVRLGWVMVYTLTLRWRIARREGGEKKLHQVTPQTAMVIGWAGMRGIVTLGTALALPLDFPQRDLIQFTAFTVVLGTLGFQGLTLRPLINWLTLPVDTSDDEATMARAQAAQAGLASIESERDSRAGKVLIQQYETRVARDGEPVDATGLMRLQRQALAAEREQVVRLHQAGRINDEVFAGLEEELDWSEAALDGVHDERN